MHTIYAPLINANDETILIVEWLYTQGAYIHNGEIIAQLETAKSTLELHADASGYITLLSNAGQHVPVGTPIAILADSPNEIGLISANGKQDLPLANQTASKTLRWTKKAELLANKYHIEIKKFTPKDPLVTTITESDIREAVKDLSKPGESGNEVVSRLKTNQQLSSTRLTQKESRLLNRSERILILGGGNIAVLVLDILSRLPNKHAVGILDDKTDIHGTSVLNCPVLGDIQTIDNLWRSGFFDSAILAIGVSQTRAKLFLELTDKGIPLANIIDPTSLILSEVEIGIGNLIMSFCRIGPQTIIGNNNFLSAYINLEHHNILGDHCTFGPSVYTSGGVKIGNNVQFGTGISIEPRLTIGDNVTIASGVTLTNNVPSNTIVKNKPNYTFHSK
jgi:sugar O-acyltransferase (sialic acid O-acetyltransferase NeuD family)